jgi:hypothetical protein
MLPSLRLDRKIPPIQAVIHCRYKGTISGCKFIISQTRKYLFNQFRNLLILTSCSYRRRADILNEQLPTFTYASRPSSPTDPHPYPLVTTPSMRRGSGDSDTSSQIEHLIKKTLEEDDEESVVEKLADRIAGVRKITGRPRALKRFETA